MDDVPFEMELNQTAYVRYFDRPEVQKAYREQQLIQTPEYSQLPEDSAVGGRFRPRGQPEVRSALLFERRTTHVDAPVIGGGRHI